MAAVHDALNAHAKALADLNEAEEYSLAFKKFPKRQRFPVPWYYDNDTGRERSSPRSMEEAFAKVHADDLRRMVLETIDYLRQQEEEAWARAQQAMVDALQGAVGITLTTTQVPPEAVG